MPTGIISQSLNDFIQALSLLIVKLKLVPITLINTSSVVHPQNKKKKRSANEFE